MTIHLYRTRGRTYAIQKSGDEWGIFYDANEGKVDPFMPTVFAGTAKTLSYAKALCRRHRDDEIAAIDCGIDEDRIDWYALSNGMGTVMPDGTIIEPRED